MDVSDWLRDLGLERYAAVFIGNSVSMDLLPSLTAADLKDLGVSAVGHRRRLLNAIAELKPGAEFGRKAPDAGSPGIAERRQLSIMFCDIADSTLLSIRLDP